MGIGVGLVLIAIGAILAFATDIELSGLDIDVVGWILMTVGVVGLLFTLLYWAPRQRARRAAADDAVVHEHRTYREGPPTVNDPYV